MEYWLGLALYKATSLLEITKAIMPQIKHTTMDSMPKTNVVVAFGNCC